jgi:NAD(P)-dependent dehydrogenase (short-subunit alcohol dehydrogenase family)
MKKVAIVTGASRGIGAATAKLLAENGYAVCVNYQNSEQEANNIVNAIKQANGEAIAVKANIANEADIIHLFNQVDQILGPVTALVNNAGINGGICKVEDLKSDCLESVFKTNVFGIFYACREALKRMKTQGCGSIVNVSSEAARFGGNNMAHYAASKAALNTFTIAFAREAGLQGIKVNTVSPGIIDTDMYADAPSEKIEMLKKSIPFGRMGNPREVAESILWLLSDKASYLNGTIIPITGGR